MILCHGEFLVVDNIQKEPSGRIFIPPQFKSKWQYLQHGKVISAGPGTNVLPMPVTAGNTVVYEKSAGFDVQFNGNTYRVLRTYQIIAAK